MDKGFSAKMGADKGQLISKCPFGIFKSPKKELRKRSNQKNKGTWDFCGHLKSDRNP